jgi:hypothetical protein
MIIIPVKMTINKEQRATHSISVLFFIFIFVIVGVDVFVVVFSSSSFFGLDALDLNF